MNRKLLNEEMDRIRLLYGYKTENTLDENISKILGQKVISEQLGAIGRELFMGGKELANVERAALMPSLEAALKETGSITITDGRGLARSTKNVEEIALAMKEGRIAFAELGKVAKSMFKNAASLEVRAIAADIITGTASFEKKFGGMTKETIVQELMNGPGKYTKSEAETLANNFKTKKANIKPIRVEPIKPEPVKVEPIKTEPVKVKEPQIINNNNIRIELEGGGTKTFRDSEEFIRYQKQEGEAWASQYGKEYDQLARENGYKSFEEFVAQDAKLAEEQLAKKAGEGKGIFGKSLDWLKKTVKWKTIFGLAKIAGVGWLVWYLFFKDNGKKVECPEGQVDDGKGNCIPAGGGGSGGSSGSGGTGGTGGTGSSGQGGSGQDNVVMDVDGNKYTECTPPYYKGCVAKKGNDDIRKVQECLGVTPNGFFNSETESAIQNKINKKTFSPSDISSLCARSYGASNFSY